MLIGAISRATGLPKDTIRYYERLGLLGLAPSGRRGNNYKEYADDTPDRLGRIGHLKALGFTLAEIGELLAVIGGREACADLPERIEQKIRGIDERIELLRGYRARLDAVLAACGPSCCVTSTGLPTCITVPARVTLTARVGSTA